ncbi:MAG: Gfo/Idh/MocA family protein [Bryobacteraceae bacterium]
MNRRYFIMSATAAAAAARPSGLKSANDTIRVGIVGLRSRGGDHIKGFASLPNVEVAALCDVDQNILESRVKDLERLGKPKPATFVDFRKMLEDKSIDVVTIATPNHWHTLQTIWACQAGKDVYVEKPVSHNIFESKQIVAAANKYQRIVQQGSQSRSSPALQEAFKQLREGLLGEIYMARGLCFKPRNTIGKTPVEPVPPGVDYDLWTGPAPLRPFTRNRFHYNWHWFWDYGNGDFGNQGIHEVDKARWGLGVTYPTFVTAVGGKVMFDDDQETPNVLTVGYEFEVGGKKKLMTFEVRHWHTNSEKNAKIGNLYYGEKGYMVVPSYDQASVFFGQKEEPGPSWRQAGDHYANFIGAVRSRKVSDLTCPVEEGAISCTLMHLGNISYRLGRSLKFDPVNLKVIGDEEANRMFTRDYRKPFVVPEQV